MQYTFCRSRIIKSYPKASHMALKVTCNSTKNSSETNLKKQMTKKSQKTDPETGCPAMAPGWGYKCPAPGNLGICRCTCIYIYIYIYIYILPAHIHVGLPMLEQTRLVPLWLHHIVQLQELIHGDCPILKGPSGQPHRAYREPFNEPIGNIKGPRAIPTI